MAVQAAMIAAATAPAFATGTYQEPGTFLAEVFGGAVPEPQALWLTKELREQSEHILRHPFNGLRVRYWRAADRLAWILEEIGREKPITVGVVTRARRIELVRVLVFRESRGWEVRHAFFTDQFHDAALDESGDLDRSIDGISGATLSVSALTRLARLALVFSDAAINGTPPQ
jgi:hypothetical protein